MEKIREELICGVCLEFLRKPKVLLCAHSFCEECLKEMVLSYRRSQKDSKKNRAVNLECPNCRHVTELEHGRVEIDLRTNVKLKRLVEIVSDTERRETLKVLGKRGTIRPTLRKHRNRPLCATHRLPLECFCRDCSEIICRSCSTSYHHSHTLNSLQELDTLLQERTGTLRNMIQPACEVASMADDMMQVLEQDRLSISTNRNFTCDTVKLYFSQLRKALEAREKAVLSTVRKYSDIKLNTVDLQFHQLQENHMAITKSVNSLEFLLHQNENELDPSLLTRSQALSEELEVYQQSVLSTKDTLATARPSSTFLKFSGYQELCEPLKEAGTLNECRKKPNSNILTMQRVMVSEEEDPYLHVPSRFNDLQTSGPQKEVRIDGRKTMGELISVSSMLDNDDDATDYQIPKYFTGDMPPKPLCDGGAGPVGSSSQPAAAEPDFPNLQPQKVPVPPPRQVPVPPPRKTSFSADGILANVNSEDPASISDIYDVPRNILAPPQGLYDVPRSALEAAGYKHPNERSNPNPIGLDPGLPTLPQAISFNEPYPLPSSPPDICNPRSPEPSSPFPPNPPPRPPKSDVVRKLQHRQQETQPRDEPFPAESPSHKQASTSNNTLTDSPKPRQDKPCLTNTTNGTNRSRPIPAPRAPRKRKKRSNTVAPADYSVPPADNSVPPSAPPFRQDKDTFTFDSDALSCRDERLTQTLPSGFRLSHLFSTKEPVTILARENLCNTQEGEQVYPRGVCCSPVSGMLIITDVFNHCIRLIDPIKGRLIDRIGKEGRAGGQFKDPSAVIMDSNEHIFVAEHDNPRVQKFTGRGKYILKFGQKALWGTQLHDPWGLAVSPIDNKIYVTDWEKGRVLVYQSDGKHFNTLTKESSGLVFPAGITFNHEGQLLITDRGKHCVWVMTIDGTTKSRFGKKGQGPGELLLPHGIAVLRDNNIAVSESGNHRISVFGPKGEFRYSFGEKGEGPGMFRYPRHICTNAAEQLVVADENNQRIQIFDV